MVTTRLENDTPDTFGITRNPEADTGPQRDVEERLRLLGSITRHMSDSIITTDAELRITYLNEAATRLLGYTLDEIRGEHLCTLHEKPVLRKVRNIIDETLARGETWHGTLRKRRKDGSVMICDCRITPICDETGAVTSYINVLHDVTRQKAAESKIRIHKRLNKTILMSMPVGVVVIAGDDTIVTANDTFHQIFKMKQRSVTGKPLHRVLPIDHVQNLCNEARQSKKAAGPLEFRYNKAGREKIIVTGATPLYDKRILLNFSDISREREKTEKLYLTDRLASIGEMAAGLAHELNNPLTGILALSQMMLQDELPTPLRDDITCIYDEAKRAASIVKNVLLFTRNNNYEHGHANPNEVIKDILRLREYEAVNNDITVVLDLASELPDMPIDRYQLQQVFLNMVLNAEAAIKESGKPYGKLTVSTRFTGGSIVVTFTDNGCGIKKKVLPRIFDPFFTTKEIGKGTGLGLSICYGIVVKHGGSIGVETDVHEGTTFTITVPATVPEANPVP